MVGLVLVALITAGAYLAGSGARGASTSSAPNDADTAAYNFEASSVVVRQMDAAGRLQYQVEAAHVTQLPQDGVVTARDLSMHYDPPEAPAGTRRWILTAESARLPEDSDVVALQGQVQVRGRPEGADGVATFSTERLEYNIATQDITTDAPVELQSPGLRLSGNSGLRANIKQGTVELESQVHGQIVP